MGEKKTFIAYIDWIEYFDEDTTIEQKGQIFDAILRYQNGETDVRPADPAARMVFNKIRKTMQCDAVAYAEKCEKRRKAAEERWMQKHANASKSMQMDTDTETETDTDTETETETDTERPKGLSKREKIPSVSKRETASRFHPPTVEEVEAYCRERHNNVDAERFVDFYTSNGWKVGKNPMKDWKSAVRTWERREERPTMTSSQANNQAQNNVLKAVFQGLM